MTEVWSISEVRRLLQEMDACNGTVEEKYEDGSSATFPCTIQCLCDDCIEKLASCLTWAESEEEPKEKGSEDALS